MNNVKSELALFGGAPVNPSPLRAPPWPPISRETADRLTEVYLSGQWSFNSPEEIKFAQAFADYHDAKHGIFLANGTLTLQCALAACGVGAGDEVIVPALTWPATAMAAHYLGATPVFVDIDPYTLCIDSEKIEQAITSKTRAVIPVHLYGSMADLDAILSIGDKHGLAVVEDCAHVHGGRWNGRGVGSWGNVGSFSFQQTKTMSSGEGGICITNDSHLAELIFRMKHIGYKMGSVQGEIDNGPPENFTCHNFRATAFQAAILNQQLNELKLRINCYNVQVDRLKNRLKGIHGLRVQAPGRLATSQSYYCLAIIFDEEPMAEIEFSQILAAISAEGLTVGGTYGPVYQHLLFNLGKNKYRIDGGRCPVAEGSSTERTITLPHQWLGADKETIDIISDILAKVCNNSDALHTKHTQDGPILEEALRV